MIYLQIFEIYHLSRCKKQAMNVGVICITISNWNILEQIVLNNYCCLLQQFDHAENNRLHL